MRSNSSSGQLVIPLIGWELQQDDGQWRELRDQNSPQIFTLNITIGDGDSRKSDIRHRTDGRCGPDFRLGDGSPAECNPESERSCCSPGGWCGKTKWHCLCPTCIDYKLRGPHRMKNSTVKKLVDVKRMRAYDELRELDIEETEESLR